jgi:hypothetical protein
MARRYFTTVTLLASDPDVNIRTIRRVSDDSEVVKINREMSPWTEDDEKALIEIEKAKSDGDVLDLAGALNTARRNRAAAGARA